MQRFWYTPLIILLLLFLLTSLACNLPVVRQFPTAPAAPTVLVPSLAPTTLTGETAVVPPPDLPPAYPPVFESAPCAFAVPSGTNPECGYLIVPENRARPDTRLLRLHVAVFRSVSPTPAADPLVFLSGGPGSSALSLAGYVFRQGLGQALSSRDVLMFDQRGTGYSEPLMTCPERDALTPALLAGSLPAAEREPAVVDAFRRCHDRLSAQGIDLTAYTSTAIAADIEDLRQVLGYAQVNLLGISYGTRVALTMMRDYPSLVRSVVLDSTVPLQINLYTALAPNAERAFNVLFDHCAADPACEAAHPALRENFYQLVDQLNASPMPLTLRAGGAAYPILVDGSLLIDVVFVGLYNPYGIASMPKMIDDLRQGNTAILEDRLALYFDPSTALGMQMSVICSEELPFSPPEEAEQLAQGVQPQIAAFFPNSARTLLAACQHWSAAVDPRENQPVASSIPALVLAGTFDPITPPDWGQLAAGSLSQATFYTFPSNGHWVTRSSPCALGMMLAFLQDPASVPDAGCISEIGRLVFR